MIEVILSIVIFGLLITGMAVGVLLGRKPIELSNQKTKDEIENKTKGSL